MATFGFYQDSPNKIVSEGREISLKLERTSPTTGNLTWNLPKGAPGCSIDDLAYNGMVIVADNVPINLNQTPSNQVYYEGDPSVNRNIHAGDKIGSGIVVGSFYDDKKTTSLEVTGLVPNTPYYFAGFAVDNVGVYHREGVHSYSQDYQSDSQDPDTAGCQLIELGVLATDSTGLVPSNTYSFNIKIDGEDHSLSVLGSDATTYQNLIDTINVSLSTLTNPYVGVNPPGYGTIHVTPAEHVYAWNGSLDVELDAIISAVTPTTPIIGSYWLNTDNNVMNMWFGVNWIPQAGIYHKTDPSTPKCDDFWLNTNSGFRWDGNVWIPVTTYNQPTDPASDPLLACGTHWLNTTTNALYRWDTEEGSCTVGTLVTGVWTQVEALSRNDDPRYIPDGVYWYNSTTPNGLLRIREFGRWNAAERPQFHSVTPPTNPVFNSLWINPATEQLFQWSGSSWVELVNKLIIWETDPLVPTPGQLWFNDHLYAWDAVNNEWIQVASFIESDVNPANTINITNQSLWNNDSTVKQWDGMQWVDACTIQYTRDPTNLMVGTLWNNTTTNTWHVFNGVSWDSVDYIKHDSTPTNVTLGQYWYDTSTHSLYVWNGVSWVPLMFQTTPVNINVNTLWYNPSSRIVSYWTGGEWLPFSVPSVSLTEAGHLKFISGTTGSKSSININELTVPMRLFNALVPAGRIQTPFNGTDGLLPTPSYNQLGVGTDGSAEERRALVDSILMQLGHPTIQVELTKPQLEFCIDRGLHTLRRMGSSGYERVYFFMMLKGEQQHYQLTDQTVGFHKITNVLGIHRMSSAFLGTAEGQGVYGQMVLQHLYSMGTFDLVSYHIINEYIELMEKMFAGNIMYSWKEKTRTLSIHQNLWKDERVLIDAMIERTEQDILTDRFLNNWIMNWATSEACLILAEVRGKHSSLPGAGGGISLNSSDLRIRAEAGFAKCIQELDDYVANNIESIGMNASFIMG